VKYRLEEVLLDGRCPHGRASAAFVVPIRTVSALNVREHVQARARRVKRERDAVLVCWPRALRCPVPCQVELVRLSPASRSLDDDNLRGALKAIRDEVARLLGVDDADARVEWHYAQERGQWGVRVGLCAGLGGELLPELPRKRKARLVHPGPRPLSRAFAQAGHHVSPSFIPARKP
jgi:hypothetical protein